MSVSVTFQPIGRKVKIASGETVWAAAEKAHVPIASICGGQSICGKCRIRIIAGKVNSVSQVEREYLTEDELQTGYRLACEVQVIEPVIIETPEIKEDQRSKLEVPVSRKHFPFSPGIFKVEVKIPPASLADPRSDATRLVDTLKKLGYNPPSQDLNQLRLLPDLLRRNIYHLCCVFDTDRLIGLESGISNGAFYGLAVDLGTTTVAAYLINLHSGELAGASAAGNRQAIYGDDIMSRLSYAQSDGQAQLQMTIVETINALVKRVCSDNGVQPEAVYALTITGNTSMLHFLSGLPTDNLGVAPYVATSTEMLITRASDLGIEINPSSTVWLLPGAGAFAGADCVCSALFAGMAESEEIQLLIDFGTNAELVLGSSQGIYACATAAGPAFEGARIEHGMRASPGAIDRVWIEDGRFRVSTIEDLPPLGIAGTGLVSAIAALRSVGMIDNSGILHNSDAISSELQINGAGATKVILTAGTADRPTITLSQKDVSEYQLAKAAVRAGIKILQRRMGIDDAQIQRILLAGAFGSCMNAGDALAADLLPEVPVERVESAGNTAGFGAIAALVSQSQREKLCQLANSIQYVELSVEPDFNRIFAQALRFD